MNTSLNLVAADVNPLKRCFQMKNRWRRFTSAATRALVGTVVVLTAFSASAAKEKSVEPNLTPEQAEANYSKALEIRTADILKILSLADTNKAAKVHDIIVAQYRALKGWHDENDAKLKATRDTNGIAQIRTSLKPIHDGFLSKLSQYLTPEQVDQVKDKMTYGKVMVTYNAYVEIVPNLTDAEKARMLELLKQAREEAIDGGSADEKSAIFKKYKGKINIYLSANGHDVGKAYKDWGSRQKARWDGSTNPVAK